MHVGCEVLDKARARVRLRSSIAERPSIEAAACPLSCAALATPGHACSRLAKARSERVRAVHASPRSGAIPSKHCLTKHCLTKRCLTWCRHSFLRPR